MTQQEIEELAGHRAVSPWIVKLIRDCLQKERQQILAVLRRDPKQQIYKVLDEIRSMK